MIRINLLGDALAQGVGKKESPDPTAIYDQGEQKSSGLPIIGLVIGLLFVACSGVYYVWLTKRVESARTTNAELQAKKAELQKYYALEKQYRDQKAALMKKKEVIVGLRLSQRAPVYLLAELANCLPDGVWFRKMSQKGNAITIEGDSTSFEAVNLLKNRLMERNKYFQNVQYPKADKKGSIVGFSLSFEFKPQS
ncbi:MAG: Fimbrial assembly protein (PilN) [Holophagaceae bacterium]|nr:Fimbrial assembly protein (PilN) [Holophagaceae bacterium]